MSSGREEEGKGKMHRLPKDSLPAGISKYLPLFSSLQEKIGNLLDINLQETILRLQ
jgi:hypothetical protein